MECRIVDSFLLGFFLQLDKVLLVGAGISYMQNRKYC